MHHPTLPGRLDIPASASRRCFSRWFILTIPVMMLSLNLTACKIFFVNCTEEVLSSYHFVETTSLPHHVPHKDGNGSY